MIYPLSQYAAARGMPTVMFDKDSFLPFGDSTFDAIHSSWSYHTGFSRATCYEFYRVLRPGGFLVLRSIAAARHTLDLVLAFGLEKNMTCQRQWCASHSPDQKVLHDNYLVCQMPGYT